MLTDQIIAAICSCILAVHVQIVMMKLSYDIINRTVILGQPAMLTCIVENPRNHKVAWYHIDTGMLISVDNQMLLRDSRIRIHNTDRHVWSLEIKNVSFKDNGEYMCQLNSPDSESHYGYIKVLDPPNIIDSNSSTDLITNEHDDVSLECNAKGHPKPKILWRRESRQRINLNSSTAVEEFNGNVLRLQNATRQDMGAYYCIAQNGIPPPKSKRIFLGIFIVPTIKAANPIVYSSVNSNVSLKCTIEAYPHPDLIWMYNGEQTVQVNDRRSIYEVSLECPYRFQFVLVIYKVRKYDYGVYSCTILNPTTDIQGEIILKEMQSTHERLSKQKTLNLFLENNYLDDYSSVSKNNCHDHGKQTVCISFNKLLSGSYLHTKRILFIFHVLTLFALFNRES